MSKLASLAAALEQPIQEETPKVEVKEGATKADKFEQLKALEKSLNKKLNTTNSLIKLGDRVGVPIPSIATNLPSLDNYVLGCGGIPRGRVIEIFGPESSGKTTVCLHIIAQEQKNTNNLCAFIDAEHALDPTYASKLGVNMDELIFAQPDCGEDVLETAAALIEAKLTSIIVIDSVSALVPKAELEGDMGDANIGLQARLMSQAMRKLTGIAAKSGTTVIFINQIREKVGVMFGSPETTSGGRALKFFASVRLDVRRRAVIGAKELPVGHKIEIKAVKNKVGNPLRSTEVDLLYGQGFDTGKDLIDYAARKGLITQKGAWYYYGEKNLGKGLTDAINNVNVDTELLNDIKLKLKE